MPVGALPTPEAARLLATLAVNVSTVPYTELLLEALRLAVVGAALTVSLTTALLAPVFWLSPEYTALKPSTPRGRLPSVKAAWPPLSWALPSKVAPLKKLTVPPGVALPLTLAVSVTGAPKAWDVLEAFKLIWLATNTVSATVLETLAALCASPEYCAVKLLVPLGKRLTTKIARPLTTSAVPMTALPRQKVTLPPGLSPDIWAVKVTGASGAL